MNKTKKYRLVKLTTLFVLIAPIKLRGKDNRQKNEIFVNKQTVFIRATDGLGIDVCCSADALSGICEKRCSSREYRLQEPFFEGKTWESGSQAVNIGFKSRFSKEKHGKAALKP